MTKMILKFLILNFAERPALLHNSFTKEKLADVMSPLLTLLFCQGSAA